MMFIGWQLGGQAFGVAVATFISFILVGFQYSREWAFRAPIMDDLWMTVGEIYLFMAVAMTAIGFVGWIYWNKIQENKK